MTTAGEQPRGGLSNIEAEQMVLGAILINNDAYDKTEPILSPDDFSEDLHARLYDVMARMIADGQHISPITMAPFFETDVAMTQIGGTDYLARLSAWATSPSLVKSYAMLVRRLAIRRQMVEAAEDAVEQIMGHDATEEPERAVEALQGRLDAILSHEVRRDAVSIGDAAEITLVEIDEAYRRDGSVTGLATGIETLDHHMGGMVDTNMIVLAGRPGMGKSALALTIALRCAHAGDSVLFNSLEMSAGELSARALAAQTGISAVAMRRGTVTEDDYRAIAAGQRVLAEIPLHIDDQGGLTIQTLAARARRHKRQRGLDLLVVDYIQLMQGPGIRGQNRTQEISDITMGLKALAKDLKIPVLALSQLSREVERRKDKRPVLADLRDGGSIEQDADLVLFVYREEYYLRLENASEAEINHCRGEAEVIVAKQRHGPTGSVTVGFEATTTTFRDLPGTKEMDL